MPAVGFRRGRRARRSPRDVIVTFGGVPGEITFKGLTFAGVLQINVRVPAEAPVGDVVPLVLSVAGIEDPHDTTIALK